jgi:hypothetical protein
MQIIASAERHIDAPSRRVYHYIRDFREHHPRFLPPQFSDLQIETGGVGAGTVHSFNMTLGGRTTGYRVRVGEPEPGRVLIESDPSRRMLTTFTVDADPGGGSRVRIETRWHANGVQGFFERLRACCGASTGRSSRSWTDTPATPSRTRAAVSRQEPASSPWCDRRGFAPGRTQLRRRRHFWGKAAQDLRGSARSCRNGA